MFFPPQKYFTTPKYFTNPQIFLNFLPPHKNLPLPPYTTQTHYHPHYSPLPSPAFPSVPSLAFNLVLMGCNSSCKKLSFAFHVVKKNPKLLNEKLALNQ